ncbi:MAG: pyridoxal-phosphate dependent enzyme [bacterium]|nr:MAG: pyridoxal-phosphate dependent enzyme [bacterium]
MHNWDWQILNQDFLERSHLRCREKGIVLPTFAELQNPDTIDKSIQDKLISIGLHEVHPLNLFRIHWCNDPDSGTIGPINYLEIPSHLSGVPARIIGLVGKHFPTGAHKVGATYGCLVPHLISGRFNPEFHKAVWPSTGNYCRGGVFNSAIFGVHAVAILPEQMSRERFDWLRDKGAEVIATPGCESNVKEIYDKCHELEAQGEEYLIFNQFDQFGNAIWHYEITGPTLEKLFYEIKSGEQRVTAFISATGSAGTIAAGDYLKEKFPHCKVLASEALQCPTLLMNGFGGHRIEGIGDKHIPWIHNIKNLDAVCAIHDEEPLRILRLFNEPEGHQWLESLGLQNDLISRLPHLGLSSISNLLSSIKLAKYYELTSNDILFTIFTDSAELYNSRLEEMKRTWGDYTGRQAEIDWHSVIQRQAIDYFKELTYYERKAIHHLKYFTWVEQQGKEVEELNAQWHDENYWSDRFRVVPQWDQLIREFNQAVGT